MLGKLNEDQINALLHKEIIGRIGCHAGEKTYVVPVTYVFDGRSIIGHSGEGMKVEMMRENPSVCFEVDSLTGMNCWQSAIIWGRYEELHGHEAEKAMEKLIDRLRPLMVSHTSHPHPDYAGGPGAVRAVVYAIRIQEKTGRFEQPD